MSIPSFFPTCTPPPNKEDTRLLAAFSAKPDIHDDGSALDSLAFRFLFVFDIFSRSTESLSFDAEIEGWIEGFIHAEYCIDSLHELISECFMTRSMLHSIEDRPARLHVSRSCRNSRSQLWSNVVVNSCRGPDFLDIRPRASPLTSPNPGVGYDSKVVQNNDGTCSWIGAGVSDALGHRAVQAVADKPCF